jgi:tRNA(fMet)-specific endonuclease VapC
MVPRMCLQKKGYSIGAMDMMIAAHARATKRTLVTNNENHFSRVSNLKIENWRYKEAIR